jgi:hypothetical protein
MKTAQEIMKEYRLTKEGYSDQGGSYFTVENIERAMEAYANQFKIKKEKTSIFPTEEDMYLK